MYHLCCIFISYVSFSLTKCFLLPKNLPNQIPKDQWTSLTPVIMSARKHLSNHNQFCTMAVFNSAWANQFGVLKQQFGAVSWGEAFLAAWVSLFGALSWSVSQALSRDREHRLLCYHVLEHGSAQPGLWCVVMSFVRAVQAGADTSPVSLGPVNGLGERHSAVLCFFLRWHRVSCRAVLVARARTGPLFMGIKDLFMHHRVLGEVEWALLHEWEVFCSSGRGVQVKQQLSEEHGQSPGGCRGAVGATREELHLSLGSTKLCATGGHVQLPVL